MRRGKPQKLWYCPFYEKTSVYGNVRSIRCEGGSRMSFPDRTRYDAFADRVCCTEASRNCTVARNLYQLYDEEEN